MDFVLLDGTLAECDRVGDGRGRLLPLKHRRHGANVQVVTDSGGRLLRLSPALPGRAHDLTAARTHRIIRIWERQGVPILADLAYQSGGPWVSTGINAGTCRNSPSPRRPSTGLWPRHGRRSSAASRA
ncbi:hypothetical protein GCM10017771_14850 [Streptomyces capitiformicae]|uniref:DDE Tnp4 domain-containing protein n=1 Tax=Streptomyces capitiformicae TaxID=2014920 RepID=A0A919GIR8_9ACTN|nr:hypothetical protein GCM10017771_14850 [Streptomyces capitiformicae]